MAARITAITPRSPAYKAGILPGDVLLSANGQPIRDVLDYKFYTYEDCLDLELEREGERRTLHIRKPEGLDLGLDFESYLMDEQKGCANRCVFCFIDQLPKGLRPTLYFKDDDARLSFLIGNYISLTNLSDRDAERIIRMKVSPLNISVHTTNPELRTLMLGHRSGGESLKYLHQFAAAGITINAQIVACPGLNDGAELERTVRELSALHPSVRSIAAVPVGLTKYREGLYPLAPMGIESARQCIAIIDAARAANTAAFGKPLISAADEMYLKADLPMPDAEYYCDFDQLENGVGLMALFERELEAALRMEDDGLSPEPFTVACGEAAASFITRMIDRVAQKCDNLQGSVQPIRNDFFGDTVDVSGLVTGGDIIAQLTGKSLAPRLLIPDVMLRHGETVFLDDTTVADIESALGITVTVHPVDGGAFLDAILGTELGALPHTPQTF